MRLQHLAGELQQVRTESQGEGDGLPLGDAGAIVRRGGQPRPGAAEQGAEHSRRPVV